MIAGGSPSVTTVRKLTCPMCGHTSAEVMPTDACVYFHCCAACDALVTPMSGHCCVYCSYGSVTCPPVQVARSCCGPGGGAA